MREWGSPGGRKKTKPQTKTKMKKKQANTKTKAKTKNTDKDADKAEDEAEDAAHDAAKDEALTGTGAWYTVTPLARGYPVQCGVPAGGGPLARTFPLLKF